MKYYLIYLIKLCFKYKNEKARKQWKNMVSHLFSKIEDLNDSDFTIKYY